MQRFLLQEDIARYERFLKLETVERSRQSLRRMLQEARRDLALLEAVTFGVQAGLIPFGLAPHSVPQAPAMQGAFRNRSSRPRHNSNCLSTRRAGLAHHRRQRGLSRRRP